MSIYRKEKHVFKKGEQYHLDQVYELMALFPHEIDAEYYQQDDIADYRNDESRRINGESDFENSAGELIDILRNFTIEIKITT